jgi:hypothetical protein
MANRTPLFNRVQPGGVFTISDVVNHPGDIWWVNSATGVDAAGYGQNPDMPVATINYAIGLATASKGDVIYIMPGHLETIINATTIVPNKAGISFIGLGRGANRPIIDYNHANAKVIASAASCRFSNLIFRATITDVVLGLEVTGSDVEVDNCLFTATDAADEFITTVLVSTCSRFNFHDNVVETKVAAAGKTRCFVLTAAEAATFQRNVIRGNWSDAIFFGLTTASTRLTILDNIIYQADTSNYNVFDAAGLATTGIFAGNCVTALYSQAASVAKLNRLTTSQMTFHKNSWSQTVLHRGTSAVPATSAT